MDKQIKELLKDCIECMEWITKQEEWETLQDGSSAKDLIKEIEEVLDERRKNN